MHDIQFILNNWKTFLMKDLNFVQFSLLASAAKDFEKKVKNISKFIMELKINGTLVITTFFLLCTLF